MRSTGVFYESYGYHPVSFSPSSVLPYGPRYSIPVGGACKRGRILPLILFIFVGRWSAVVWLLGWGVLPSDRKWELLAALGWAMFIYCSPAHMGFLGPLGVLDVVGGRLSISAVRAQPIVLSICHTPFLDHPGRRHGLLHIWHRNSSR
jgi:hypothetical protein